MAETRKRSDIFQTDYQKHKDMRFKDYMIQRWRLEIDRYAKYGWAMIPIAVRSKLPLKTQRNYESKAAGGPYLTPEQAIYWIRNDFNLAVVAGPSAITWCDADDPNLFKKDFLRGQVMRTPRGFALPLLDDWKATRTRIEDLKKKGYDFREGISYELVPLSETCLQDHELHGRKHPGPRELCVTGDPHEYRMREWITDLGGALLGFRDFLEIARAD